MKVLAPLLALSASGIGFSMHTRGLFYTLGTPFFMKEGKCTYVVTRAASSNAQTLKEAELGYVRLLDH
jgi:hypothetical protein